MNPVYVTSNPEKAKYFALSIGIPVEQANCDLTEIQSLSLAEIVEHKAKQAYDVLRRPVIVEDTKLSFTALGSLPGPFIKWFMSEIEVDGLCKLLNNYSDRSAQVGAAFAYYDGAMLRVFEKELGGRIAISPRGKARSSFGFNSIFIPDGAEKTLAQMTEAEFSGYYNKAKPFDELTKFLHEKLNLTN